MSAVLHIKVHPKYRELYEAHVEKHNKERCEDSGFDLIIPETIVFTNRVDRILVDSGICAELVYPDGRNGAYDLVARSSICKVPLCLHNCVGIIDKGYRGPIKMALRSLSTFTYTCKAGTRLCQLVLPSREPFKVKIVEELSASVRGAQGFGSTGP